MKTFKHKRFIITTFFFLTLLLISGAPSGANQHDVLDYEVNITNQQLIPNGVALHYWNFDNPEDRLQGAVVTGNRSYNIGGNITFVPSELTGGYAANFDGQSGLFLGYDFIDSSTYTISFWLKPTVVTGFTPAFWASNEGPFQWMSILPQAWWGGAGVWMYNPWQDLDPGRSVTMTANEWHHMVVTVDSGETTVYLNNSVIAQHHAINNVFGRGGAEFYLGVNRWDIPFNGLIDEVRLYNNAALTQAGVEALFNLEEPEASDFIVPESVDLSRWIIPGANRDFNDPQNPIFRDATVHDPAMTRAPITREDGEWYYIIGTFLGAARTQDFVQFEAIDYGRGYPNLRNTNNHRFMPTDNPDPSIMTFEEQVRSVVSDGGGNPPRRTDGAFMPGSVDDLVIWASDIIEVPNIEGNGTRFFQYYSFSHWGVPDSAIGVAIADTIDGPWITQGLVVSSRHANDNLAMDGTPFVRHYHPNAIDPYPMFCSDGRFWLIYGSWEGGVFIAELDPSTGLFLEGSEINREMNGYGRLLINSNSNQIEGAHMIYSPTTEYYYLFASWGSLASYAGYNVRMFRSQRPYGPFEDARFRQLDVSQQRTSGQNRIDITGEVFHHTNDSGVKIIGGYRFVGTPGENSLGRGYLSPGHGSMNWDPINERYMKIFHTRFVAGGESHQIRAHEMFVNENNWFVMAPLRFDGTGGTTAFVPEDLVGDYKILSHGRGTNTTATLSNLYRFDEKGVILNQYETPVGTWRLIEDYIAEITFRGLTFNGLFLRQFCDDTSTWVQTFTVLSYDDNFNDPTDLTTFRGASTAGIALWGVGVSAGVAFDGDVNFEDVEIDDEPPHSDYVLSPTLPNRDADGALVWNFNNSFDGAIPVGRGDFDTIIELENRADDALTFVADRHGNPNSAIRIGGNLGNAGIYLGENVIDTDDYSISMWVKPETLNNGFGSLFFGAVAGDTWKSLHPATGQSYGEGPGTLAYWSGSYLPNPWRNNVSNGRLIAGEWSHVTITVSNGTVNMFLDGVPLDVFRSGWPAGTNLAPMFENNLGRFFLGINFFSSDPIFNGAIDELSIFNRALTPNEVMSLFDPEYTPDLTPAGTPVLPQLINGAHHWSFNVDLGGAVAVRSRDGFVNVNPELQGNIPIVAGRNGANAAHFTGTGGGIYLGDNIIEGDTYTIAFWANPDTISEWSAMFFAGNRYRHISITPRHGGGSTTAFLVPGHQWHFNAGVVPTNTWTHFAFSSNGESSSFYINGQRTDTVLNSTDVFGPLNNGQFFLGVTLFDDLAFRGMIQDLYIFPETSLESAEIRTLAGIEEKNIFIMPGANSTVIDPDSPLFSETSIHDPSLTRNRSANGWFYAVGTDLGAARTRNFMEWESINYGLGNPQIGNPGNRHSFFPIDNPNPEIETMEQQIRYIGSFHQFNENNAIFWASEIIEVNGRYFHYYSLAGGINEWNWSGRNMYMPQAGLGLAVADSIDGPWVTQGTFIRSGYSNRYYNGERVPFNDTRGINMAMYGDVEFNPDIHPNSIDSSPFICADGNLWLVYGSYGGGVFLLEMDSETGLPLSYEESEINRANDGFGTLLIASTHHQGEGPHMIYSETSGYYYLFQTYGWLASYGGYHVRMWRSRAPYGPFEDARFSQMHVQTDRYANRYSVASRWLDTDGTTEFGRLDMGIKINGGHHFISAPNEEALSTAYLSPGHGGLIFYEGRYLKVFHTRFVGRWEWHQVRVHEMFMNCNGWFVMAPIRFDGGEATRSFEKHELVGDFKIIEHGRDTNRYAHESSLYRFTSAGEIIDEMAEIVGSWTLTAENIANINLYGISYNGVFLRQYDEANSVWVQNFTALSYDNENTQHQSRAGLTLWGKGISSGVAYEIPEVTPSYPEWERKNVYNTGDRVVYNGRIFEAQWWTSNQSPTSSVWSSWMEIETITLNGENFNIWTPSRVFNTGEQVIYNGELFEAQWWTRNQTPSINHGPWIRITQ